MESINWIQIPAEFKVSIIRSRRTTLKSRPGMESIIGRNKTNRRLTSTFPWKKFALGDWCSNWRTNQTQKKVRLVFNFSTPLQLNSSLFFMKQPYLIPRIILSTILIIVVFIIFQLVISFCHMYESYPEITQPFNINKNITSLG